MERLWEVVKVSERCKFRESVVRKSGFVLRADAGALPRGRSVEGEGAVSLFGLAIVWGDGKRR